MNEERYEKRMERVKEVFRKTALYWKGEEE
jgi:hypothetical protein